MTLELTIAEILIAIFIVAAGTAVQAAVGFGLAMIAAPILILVDRAFVPAPLIMIALCLVVWMAWHERSEVDLTTVKIAIIGRLIGTPPAALLIGTMSAAAFDLVFGLLVLIAVLISLIHTKIQPDPKNLFIASAASGFMSTISSIGGPPLALIYQNVRGPKLRASLSVFFILGCLVSLTALWFVGKLTFTDLGYTAIMLLGLVLGILLSHPLKRYLEERSVRPWLLFLCGFSSIIVLLRAWYTW